MKNIDKTREQLLKEIEQLKAKNAELEKNKEIFQIIAESTSDNIAITTFDLKAKYIYVSPSVKHVLGYDPKDLLGKSFFDFIHPADKKVLLPLIKKYIKLIVEKVLKVNDTTITETIEFRFKDKAGKWHYMHSTVNFIGKNLLAVTRDITERKQAQEEIINSEKKFRILTESAPIGVYYNDLNGTFLYGNKSAEEIIGYKRDEMIGKNFLKMKLLDPKHILKAAKLLALNKLGKSTGPDNFTLNTKNGAQRQVEISTTIINIEEQEVVLGMVQDITERKQAEDKLIESEKKYKHLSTELESIFDHLPGPVFYKDRKNRFIWVNKYIADAHKTEKRKLMGKSLFDLYPKDQAQEYWEDDLEVINSCVPKINIEETWEIDEGKKWVNTSKIPFVDDNGDVCGIIGMSIDITERKQAEEVLKKKMNQLEIFNKSAVDRELRMIELKKEVNELLKKAREPKKY